MEDDLDWAWAAGVFEGEGSIVPHAGRCRLQVKMTDFDIIHRLWAVMGGSIYGPYHYEGKDGHVRKPVLVWTSDRADAVAILQRFYPYLGERKSARALEIGGPAVLRSRETLAVI